MNNFLCQNHLDIPRLATPIKIKCQMCSTTDPQSFRDSFYANAQICEECSQNTDYCMICQNPI